MSMCPAEASRILWIKQFCLVRFIIVLKRIAVADLCLGMFIHEFCGSWMDHPFWKVRFLLKSERDLQRVRASGIREVWIDLSKGCDVASGQSSSRVKEIEEVEADAE